MTTLKTSFEIGFDGADPNDNGIATGFIKIGDFSERFVVGLGYWDLPTYMRQWREALRRLLNGSPSVGLMTWMIPPGSSDNARAWILYREGEQVFIQERIFVSLDLPAKFDEHQHLVGIRNRRTVNKDGDRLSEWRTDTRSIQEFLSHA